MSYYKCKCGSNEFVRIYNVWNEKIKIDVTEKDGKEFWDVEIVWHFNKFSVYLY